MKLSNAFDFKDPQTLVIIILHGLSRIHDKFRLYHFMFSFVISS